MDVVDLFSVPILVHDLDNNEQLHYEEIEILKSVEVFSQQSGHNLLSYDNNILTKYNLNRIKNICDKYVSKYLNEVLFVSSELQMFSSWLSVNKKFTKHYQHSHVNTMLSCLIYFDEFGSDQFLSPIVFSQNGLFDVFKSFQFKLNTTSDNRYNSQSVVITPKTNTLIVFPGWLKHYTIESSSNVERYCLGTNYFFVGESGSNYHRLNLEVKK